MLLQVGINHLTVFFNSIQFVFLVLLMYLLAIWLYLCQVGFSYISIPEKDSSIAITGTLQLVFTQTEDSAPVTFWSSGYPAKAFNTSLPGPQVLGSYPSRNSSSNVATRPKLPVALPMRQPERQTGGTLSALCNALVIRSAPFKSAKEAIGPIQQFHQMEPTVRHPSPEPLLVPRSRYSRKWPMGEVTSQAGIEAPFSLQSSQAEQRQRKRQIQRRTHANSISVLCRPGPDSRTPGSSANLPGGTVVDGSTSATPCWECAHRACNSCSYCSSICCRDKAQDNVCLVGETPRWPSPR